MRIVEFGDLYSAVSKFAISFIVPTANRGKAKIFGATKLKRYLFCVRITKRVCKCHYNKLIRSCFYSVLEIYTDFQCFSVSLKVFLPNSS